MEAIDVVLTQHMEALDVVLTRLDQANLSARPDKCFLGFEEVSYRGNVVGRGQI